MEILRVDNLVKEYKSRGGHYTGRVLNGLNLSVERGEFVAVMGPSGSGKTTLLNIVGGMDMAYDGQVQIAGISLNEMQRDELALFRRRRMGFIFQNYNLLDSLTLKQNIMLPLALDGCEPAEMGLKADEAMAWFEIAEIGSSYPYAVSGGQQQRAGIARAVINEPEVIFADEPTGNLDSKSSRTVMRYFGKLNADKQATILMVTHDPFAASYCDRVMIIQDGTIATSLEKPGDRTAFFDLILDHLGGLAVRENDL